MRKFIMVIPVAREIDELIILLAIKRQKCLWFQRSVALSLSNYLQGYLSLDIQLFDMLWRNCDFISPRSVYLCICLNIDLSINLHVFLECLALLSKSWQIYQYIYIYIGCEEEIVTISNYSFRVYTLFVLGFVYCVANLSQCQWGNKHQKFRNGMLNGLAFTSEAPIRRFPKGWVSIWGYIHIHIDENQVPSPHYGVCGGHYTLIIFSRNLRCRGLHQLPDWGSGTFDWESG